MNCCIPEIDILFLVVVVVFFNYFYHLLKETVIANMPLADLIPGLLIMAKPLWGSLLQRLERSLVPTLNGLFITAVWGAGVQAEVSTSKVTLRLRPHLQPDKPIVTANKTILIFFFQVATGLWILLIRIKHLSLSGPTVCRC